MRFDLNQRSRHQAEHLGALEEGLRRHGALDLGPNAVACWGWRVGRLHRARGRDVLVMERGYLGDRFFWTSIAWNGLNGRGTFPEYPDDGGARFRRLGLDVKPWSGGDYALIAGQVPGDMALGGRNLTPWYAEQARRASIEFGLPAKFRPHPLARRRGPVRPVLGAEMIGGDMGAALSGAAIVLTFNSNLGVDALVAGKRATCDDPGSMIHGVTEWQREAWLHRLAWKQWSMDEIRSGEALVGIVEDLRSGRFGEDRRPRGNRAQAENAAATNRHERDAAGASQGRERHP